MGSDATWSIGLEPWIVQDGHYDDFRRGTTECFALEFYAPRELTPTAVRERRADHIGSCRYRVVAAVVHATPAMWVIDFGVRAYVQGAAPPEIGVGDWVEGEIYLGIDHFAYMEHLHLTPNAPPLIYTWSVERVLEESGTYEEETIELAGRPTVVQAVDTTRVTTREVEETDSSNVTYRGSMFLHYVLRCRLAGPPGRERISAALRAPGAAMPAISGRRRARPARSARSAARRRSCARRSSPPSPTTAAAPAAPG